MLRKDTLGRESADYVRLLSQQGNFRFFQDYYFLVHSGLLWKDVLYSLWTLLKQTVLCREVIPEALFIQFLYSVEHPVYKCFIYQPGTEVTSCV